jgi:hypothetical protein
MPPKPIDLAIPGLGLGFQYCRFRVRVRVRVRVRARVRARIRARVRVEAIRPGHAARDAPEVRRGVEDLRRKQRHGEVGAQRV